MRSFNKIQTVVGSTSALLVEARRPTLAAHPKARKQTASRNALKRKVFLLTSQPLNLRRILHSMTCSKASHKIPRTILKILKRLMRKSSVTR